MKKVRLFAVAAAMGMFASTVSAAEYVTKDAYVATWGSVDEIIKVDVGDKVVAPTANISVVKETRSTDPKYATTSGSLGLEDSNICFEGFTNTAGEDTNEDGYVDAPILTAGINNLTTQQWLHTDAKFFPTAKTATYYVGLGNGEATGGRFLAPGAAKKDVYALALNHQHLADETAVLKYFEDAGILEFNYDEDEYISYVDVNPITINDEKGKSLGTVSLRVSSKNTRYADDSIKEDIVSMLVSGVELSETTDYKVATVIEENYDNNNTFYEYKATINKVVKTVPQNSILIVEEDRYGNLIPTDISTSGDLYTFNEEKLAYPKDGKIIIALNTEDTDKNGNTIYSKYMTITPSKGKANTPVSSMVWDDENGTFVKQVNDARPYELGKDSIKGYYWNNKYDSSRGDTKQAVTATAIDIPAHALGLYHLETPANTSDKIVIYTEGLNLTVTGINTKKETISIAYDGNKEITTSAVKLDGRWYPAVNNEAELTKFVEKVLGLTTLKGEYDADASAANDFDKWIEKYEDAIKHPLSGVSKVSRTNAKGEKEEFIPENSLQHYKGTFCTYSIGEGTKVDATITSNADSVDTTTSGVKTLTLTAKVGEQVVGTKDVKVVVAPKYQREYKNGKVVKLTAFYLDGKTPYAIYKYDWTKKTYTATFYQQDGITVASTANGTL